MYLAWFDADRKKSNAKKLIEGMARYREKFGEEPEVALCHPADVAEVAGCEVRPVAIIARNCFWIGRDEV